ncbi:MAG: hypothetical protein AB7T06_16980 [Kofleriaceae bacterium]
MRWVVVVLVAGCFSTPGLRDRDGGGSGDDADRGDGGGGSDGGTFDSPLAGCTWIGLGRLVDVAQEDERHPWLSSDGTFLMWWSGDAPGSTGVLRQAERPNLGSPFGTPIQIYPQSGSTAPIEADPSFEAGLLKMYIKTNSGILSSTRAMEHGVFQNLTTDANLATVMQTRDVQEGPFITSDGKTFLFVAGESSDVYNSEDLFIATRATGSGPFGTPQKYEHSVTGMNEGAPTMAGNVLMYERPTEMGKTEIVSSIFNGTSFSPPEVVVLPGINAFKQPSLSANGQRLVYVVHDGVEWWIEEAKLECPP